MIPVTLTNAECRYAVLVGMERRLRSRARQRQDTGGINGAEDGWRADIEGAGAELAFAKALGWHWDGSVDTFGQADVRHVHVRQSSAGNARLLLRAADPAGCYVLVTGLLPRYLVVGWACWPEAKHDAETTDLGHPERPPCFAIPQTALGDMDDLPAV